MTVQAVYHTRADDTTYRAWADSQSDCWYGDEEEEAEEEAKPNRFGFARQLSHSETVGATFRTRKVEVTR
jgi:hypothetical protein